MAREEDATQAWKAQKNSEGLLVVAKAVEPLPARWWLPEGSSVLD